MGQPGIMLYFDMAEPLKELGYEDKGRILEAALEYGQFGTVPDFDGILKVVWGFIRPRLDKDAKAYRKKVVKNTFSSYCAQEKKAGRTPLDLQVWLEHEGIDSEWNRTIPVDSGRYPTPYSNTDSTAAPYSNTDSKSITEWGVGEDMVERDFDEMKADAIRKLQEMR